MSERDLLDELNTLRKLLPALIIITPFAAAWWLAKKPLRRAMPVLTVELLVVVAVAHETGLLPL